MKFVDELKRYTESDRLVDKEQDYRAAEKLVNQIFKKFEKTCRKAAKKGKRSCVIGSFSCRKSATFRATLKSFIKTRIDAEYPGIIINYKAHTTEVIPGHVVSYISIQASWYSDV